MRSLHKMGDEDKIFTNRIMDLAKLSYNQNRYTFSNFLSVEEQALIDGMASELRFVSHEMYGGHESCERRMIRFGSLESLGYEEKYPITVLCIEPLIDKFADDLSHRDFLGALMNLGIKRNVLGDIIVKGNKAYLFCLDEISDYIISEITRIKHTSVKLTRMEGEIPDLERRLEDFEVLVSSPRLDGIVAAICKLSRSHAVELFRAKKVMLNNRICENNSQILKEGNTFSIRGYGKFVYNGEGGKTRKDRVYVRLSRYV